MTFSVVIQTAISFFKYTAFDIGRTEFKFWLTFGQGSTLRIKDEGKVVQVGSLPGFIRVSVSVVSHGYTACSNVIDRRIIQACGGLMDQ